MPAYILDKAEVMTYKNSAKSSGSKSSGSKSYSSARAHQKVGQSFGGYTKIQASNGQFRMKPTSK